MTLLGQKVDAFEDVTENERVAALRKLAFPKTAADLDHYLGATGRVRSKIPYYSYISAPLQREGRRLLKGAPAKHTACKRFTAKTPVDGFPEMRLAYDTLQNYF